MIARVVDVEEDCEQPMTSVQVHLRSGVPDMKESYMSATIMSRTHGFSRSKAEGRGN